jgi:hypothetical protein
VVCLLLGSIVLLTAPQSTYAFIDHPKVGDEYEISNTIQFVAPPIYHSTERRTIKEANASGETVLFAPHNPTSPHRPYFLHFDLFLHEKPLRTRRRSADIERAQRSQWFYPPDSQDYVLSAGRNWARVVDLNGRDDIPLARYVAKFEGFENIQGLKCAKVVSAYQELSGKYPIRVEQTLWFYSGLQYIKRLANIKNAVFDEGIFDVNLKNVVTYWKFGPASLNRRRR